MTEEAANPQDRPPRLLPPWDSVRAKNPPRRSPELISGLLRRGHVMMLAGKGKTGKSWAAIQLSVAVATGGEWLGHKCESGGVLYIDPEIDPKSLDNRFSAVCEAAGADPRQVGYRVSKWSLRGVEGACMTSILHDLEHYTVPGQYALVVFDSASVFLEGDENSSVDVRRFAAKVLQVAAVTGASVLLVHHYGKGAAGDKAAADRARGSSVWLDFPDVALFITGVCPPSGEPSDYLEENTHASILECGGQREFAQPEPVRLLFHYPIHSVDLEGITEGWKPNSAQSKGGKQKSISSKTDEEAKLAHAEAELLAVFYSEHVGSDGVSLKEAAEIVGVDPRTLEARLAGSNRFEIVATSPRKRRVRAKVAPRPVQSEIGLSTD